MIPLALRRWCSLGFVAALGCAPVVSEPGAATESSSRGDAGIIKSDLKPELEPLTNSRGDAGVIRGVVKKSTTEEPVEYALVVLQCTCLAAPQERFTNERGIYSFEQLPAGNYTIQVLAGKANVSKVLELPQGAKFKANFSVNPEQDIYIGCGLGSEPEHRSTPIYLRTTAGNSLRDAFEASPY